MQDYRLGSVSVACEGYDYPEDPYILAGSCGLEYTLELTQQGRDKRGTKQQQYGSSYNSHTVGEIFVTVKWVGTYSILLYCMESVWRILNDFFFGFGSDFSGRSGSGS